MSDDPLLARESSDMEVEEPEEVRAELEELEIPTLSGLLETTTPEQPEEPEDDNVPTNAKTYMHRLNRARELRQKRPNDYISLVRVDTVNGTQPVYEDHQRDEFVFALLDLNQQIIEWQDQENMGRALLRNDIVDLDKDMEDEIEQQIVDGGFQVRAFLVKLFTKRNPMPFLMRVLERDTPEVSARPGAPRVKARSKIESLPQAEGVMELMNINKLENAVQNPDFWMITLNRFFRGQSGISANQLFKCELCDDIKFVVTNNKSTAFKDIPEFAICQQCDHAYCMNCIRDNQNAGRYYLACTFCVRPLMNYYKRRHASEESPFDMYGSFEIMALHKDEHLLIGQPPNNVPGSSYTSRKDVLLEEEEGSKEEVFE